MGWWSKVKSVVKKTAQTVVPGGSKGYLEPSKPKPTEAGTLTPTGGAASKRSPSENVERASRGIKDNDVPKKNNSIIDYGKKTISTIGKVLTGEEVGGFKTGLGSTAPYTDPKTDITREVPVLAGTVPITPGAGLASTTPAIKSFLHFSKTYNAAGATGKAGTVVSTAKTATQTIGLLKKSISPKALVFYGAWAGSIGMNLWANAEAPEGIMFPVNKYLIPEAEETGDWSAVNEAIELADEITDLSMWEKIIGMSPFAIIPGALNKLKGNVAGKEILKKYSEDQQDKQSPLNSYNPETGIYTDADRNKFSTDEAPEGATISTGQSEDDYWTQRAAEQAEEDRAIIDYYNDERKKQLQWEEEAANDDRDADAKFWREERAKQRQKETEDREAIADFWTAYRKQAQKAADDSRPSNLNFGLF